MTDETAQPTDAITVRSLEKRFGEVVAVAGIDFAVKRGTITGLLGGNGAGKTTTISMLLGLLTPTGGEIEVMGVDMLKNRYGALAKMNFSSPYVDLPRRLTVRENLTVYGRLYGVPDLKDRLDELAESLDVLQFLDRPFGRLSAGQQTRVALAKALLNRPELLLLDEPTASLDPDTADRMRTYLEDYCRENDTTVLLASHNMREVERLCDDVLIMKTGRIVDCGSPAELVERYGRADMEEVFLHVARTNDDGEEAA